MLQRNKISSLLVLCGVVTAAPAFGQSGTFTFVTGEVNVQRRDGQRVTVARGMPVNPGDAIVTGTKGMAQLTMVDQAKISLRPNTQFQIEQYADRADSDQGAVLSLVRGTLRTFTGLIASRNRDRFVMKTKVATVGIRGSGNVLFAGTATDCDPDKVDAGAGGSNCDIAVNHTIEGSHAVTFGDFPGSGLPPQQGGAQTLVTGPGQTVLVTGRGEVKYIPTPLFIANAAANPTNAEKGGAAGDTDGEARNFGPGDGSGSMPSQGTVTTTPVGNNGLGFVFLDAVVSQDPQNLQDIVFAGGSTLAGQALPADIVYEGTGLRAYDSYPASQTGLEPSVVGGSARDARSYADPSGLAMAAGRWQGAGLRYFANDLVIGIPGSLHWIQAGSGYPVYLADVLTGTATYSRVVNTDPTNQDNTVGTLNSATINVNFSNRTLNAALGVSIPVAGTNPGGSWQLTATDVPFALNTFYATTDDRLRIVNGNGVNSQGSSNLSGGFEGSFVGSALSGAILGYTIADQTSATPSGFNSVAGVVGFSGPAQDLSASYRDGLVSDPQRSLENNLVRNYAVSNRPTEVAADADGRVTAFAAPYEGYSGGHNPYSLGTASVAQFGRDAETGLVWGRWSGGTAVVNAEGQQRTLPLSGNSLHYVFSDVQSGPVSLPLTGTATYDLVGATSPTTPGGSVGTLDSATLAANFTNRTVDTSVSLTIAGTSITGIASNVPIFREQYFSAFRGSAPGGLPVPQLLNITCSPACAGAAGSIEGFFAGRTGQGAGMMYNLNGASGAAAFRRAGG